MPAQNLQVIGILFAFLLRSKNKLTGRYFEGLLALDHLVQLHVVLGVANHHTSKQVLPIHSEQVLLVDSGEGVLVCQCLDTWLFVTISVPHRAIDNRWPLPWKEFRPISVGKEVTKAGNVNTKELELCAQIGSLEALWLLIGICQVE